MNRKERERIKVLARLAEGSLTQRIAAKQLSIGVRQVQRLLKKYRKQGDITVISKKRGHKSNNRLSDSVREQTVKLIKQCYSDFGPTLAKEKLEEVHNLVLPVSTVRNLMIEYKIWTPKNWKKVQVHKRRDCRACFGELLQMDGSYHDWFEGRSPKCCLIVLIDDATSRLMWLQFVHWETCFGYFNALKGYIKKFGTPLSVYTDKHAIFETTRKTEKDYKDTQLHRALSELEVKLILAGTPQAKGRVERANGILQDRLIKEMRLASISSMEEGNEFLATYIEQHNRKFAKVPKSSVDAHKALDPKHNLERILCLHQERVVSKDLMISWKGRNYQITETNSKYRLGKKKVLIMEQGDESFEIMYNGKVLKFENFNEQPAEVDVEYDPVKLNENWKKARGSSPSKNHPWRKRVYV